MLYFDRIDVSKGTGANKTKESKEYVFKYVCKHVFKVLIGEPFCSAFKDYFETMENNTRNNNCIIRLPAAKLEAYRKSFKFNGGKVFNSLPHKCRAATLLDDFLKVFDEF